MFKLLIRLIKIGIPVGLILFGLIQIIPYGHSHSDPPVSDPVTWNSPETQQLAMQACGDCHSNQTNWPWYSYVAPVSWLVQHHVDHARQILNFSDIGSASQRGIDRAAQSVQNGRMPPFYYKLTHPTSRLTAEQTQKLVDGLRASLGSQFVGSVRPENSVGVVSAY